MNGCISYSVLGYNFEHDKQLAFGSLFTLDFYTVPTRPKKDETAVYGWSCWLNPSSFSYWFTDKLISTQFFSHSIYFTNVLLPEPKEEVVSWLMYLDSNSSPRWGRWVDWSTFNPNPREGRLADFLISTLNPTKENRRCVDWSTLTLNPTQARVQWVSRLFYIDS